jgi:S1/P1 Nuclease
LRPSRAGQTPIARFTSIPPVGIFVDIPLAAEDYGEDRDCAPSAQGDCVIHELARSLGDLTDSASSAAERRDALKFVVHLVGDVNQPLHTLGELRGYSEFAVYFSSPAKNDCVATNLHIVWDVGLIRSIFGLL